MCDASLVFAQTRGKIAAEFGEGLETIANVMCVHRLKDWAFRLSPN